MSTAPESVGSAVALAAFEDQTAALVRGGWTVVGLTEALQLLDVGSSRRVVALTFDDGLRDLLDAVAVLERFGARATAYIPTGFMSQRSAAGVVHLSWSQVQEAARSGIEVGAHTVSHRPMDVLPPSEIARELRQSKEALEDQVGVPVTSLSYPHGYSSPRVRAEARAAGYTNACTVGRRTALSTDDRVALPRLEVTSGHVGAAFLDLLQFGETGLAPCLKRYATPAWRLTRTATYRASGRLLR